MPSAHVSQEQETQGELIELNEVPLSVPQGSEIDVQIATARRYPRSLKVFLEKATTMATLDEDTAASCFYKLPRSKKMIEGPGVRLAEIVASAWGNLRFGARVVEETDKYIKAEGYAHDLETNTAVSFPVLRRITDKYGKKYSDDMIITTSNAASAIALRNSIFRVIPKAYIDQIYQKAKQTAIGDTKTLSERRDKMLQYFQKLGVSEERLLSSIGRTKVEAINLKDVEDLVGISTAIKEGATSIDEVFPESKEAENKDKTGQLIDKLKK